MIPSTKWSWPKEKVVLITLYLHNLSKREGELFHITYLPSNGVYEKNENKQIRVDGLDNARMLPHTCATHSKGIGLNSKHEDLPVSSLHYANPAVLI